MASCRSTLSALDYTQKLRNKDLLSLNTSNGPSFHTQSTDNHHRPLLKGNKEKIKKGREKELYLLFGEILFDKQHT